MVTRLKENIDSSAASLQIICLYVAANCLLEESREDAFLKCKFAASLPLIFTNKVSNDNLIVVI